jgi:uncharacterized protein
MASFFKVQVFIIIFLILGIQISYAQTDCPAEFVLPTKEQGSKAQKEAVDRGFLWRVSKDNKTSYLYGTIHVGNINWMFPGPKVLNALHQSKKLAVELNFDSPEVRKELIDLILNVSEINLSIKLKERINRYAAKNCVKAESYQNLRPELQLITLETMSLRREKIYPEFGIDMTVMAIASGMKKTIIGLETPQEQMNGILSKPGELEQDISEALNKLEDDADKEMLTKIVNIWVTSDFNVLNNYAEWCKCLDTQKERDDMKRALDDRNTVMVDRFNKIHAEEGLIFMAVGALHMVGPVGIPALLKNKGYSVDRLQ